MPTIYAAIAGSATLVGLVMALFAAKFVKKYSFAIVSLAAGVMLGTAFLHIMPEASELIGTEAFVWLLVGFGVFYVIESLMGVHCCENGHSGHSHVLGSVAGVGLFFHSVLDGVAIAVGFEVSTALGLITALAVLIHELPEGIFTLSLLLHSGRSKKAAAWWTVLVALATPAGAFGALLLFPSLNEQVLGMLLGLAAGSFVYISAADLIPESHKKRSLTTGAFVVLGLMVMFVINTFVGYGHAHEHDHETDAGHDHYHAHEELHEVEDEHID